MKQMPLGSSGLPTSAAVEFTETVGTALAHSDALGIAKRAALQALHLQSAKLGWVMSVVLAPLTPVAAAVPHKLVACGTGTPAPTRVVPTVQKTLPIVSTTLNSARLRPHFSSKLLSSRWEQPLRVFLCIRPQLTWSLL